MAKNNVARSYDGVIISSRDVPVSLPVLKYGYRNERMSWSELRDIIIVEKDLGKLSRNEADQREYEFFRYHLRNQYKSIVDYILISKFRFDKVRSNNGLWKAHPQLEDFHETRKILIPNDFPYFTENRVVHYVLWKTKQEITKQDVVEARENLHSILDVEDSLHWVNPPHLKSLPEIDHVHFFCHLKKI
jgi:hypothetical protein